MNACRFTQDILASFTGNKNINHGLPLSAGGWPTQIFILNYFKRGTVELILQIHCFSPPRVRDPRCSLGLLLHDQVYGLLYCLVFISQLVDLDWWRTRLPCGLNCWLSSDQTKAWSLNKINYLSRGEY